MIYAYKLQIMHPTSSVSYKAKHLVGTIGIWEPWQTSTHSITHCITHTYASTYHVTAGT